MKMKEESEKASLKLNIKKTKIMTSSPSLQANWLGNSGKTGKTVTDFIFWGAPKSQQMVISHEIKRPLLLGRKAMTNLDSTFKSRDITMPIKTI